MNLERNGKIARLTHPLGEEGGCRVAPAFLSRGHAYGDLSGSPQCGRLVQIREISVSPFSKTPMNRPKSSLIVVNRAKSRLIAFGGRPPRPPALRRLNWVKKFNQS
jgi:hypothetical protein